MTPKEWAIMVAEKLRASTLFDGGPHGIPSPTHEEAVLEAEVAKVMAPPAGSRWVELADGVWVDCARVISVGEDETGSLVRVHGEVDCISTEASAAEVMAAVDAARAWVSR